MTRERKVTDMGYIYVMTNRERGTLYIGVTSNLTERVYQHKAETYDGFTKRYHLHKLVYYEQFPSITDAIHREKVLKGWSRAKKIALVESKNPEWNDWSEGLV